MKKALFICLVLCLAVCCAWAAADGLILKDAEGNQEGMLDEAGECTLFIFPYGNGLPMSYSSWYSDVTE